MNWNKAEDNLPPEDTMVLIVDDVKCMYVGWLIKNKWHSSDCCVCAVENTHWADLPEFPNDE